MLATRYEADGVALGSMIDLDGHNHAVSMAQLDRYTMRVDWPETDRAMRDCVRDFYDGVMTQGFVRFAEIPITGALSASQFRASDQNSGVTARASALFDNARNKRMLELAVDGLKGPMSMAPTRVQRGPRSEQPEPTMANAGLMYFVTDDNTLERSTGSEWQSFQANYPSTAKPKPEPETAIIEPTIRLVRLP